MCTMLYNKAKQKQLDKPGQYNRVAICQNNLQLLTGGRLSTSYTDWTHLKRAELSRTVVPTWLWDHIELSMILCHHVTTWRCIPWQMFASPLMYSPVEEGDWCVPARLHSALACVLTFLYCLIYNYKIILILSMILCHYMNEHTLQVAGRTVIYRYSITESLYLFTTYALR